MIDRLDIITLIENTNDQPKTDAERRLWETRRRALIMELGAIEDYLDLPRSIVPRRKREDERKAS